MASNYIKNLLAMNMSNCKYYIENIGSIENMEYIDDPSCHNLKLILSYFVFANDKAFIIHTAVNSLKNNIIYGSYIHHNKKYGLNNSIKMRYYLETHDDVSYYKENSIFYNN